MEHLNEILKEEQKSLLLKQKESRLDIENLFFMRFDKEKLIKDNIYFLTDKGNCFHVKMSIAAYPTTRKNAMKIVEDLFK